jgi:hypothetical protein
MQEQNIAELIQWHAHLRFMELPEDWQNKKCEPEIKEVSNFSRSLSFHGKIKTTCE